MTALEHVVETLCPPKCDFGAECSVCGRWLCPEHSNEFTTCAENIDLLHHVGGCEAECLDCAGANALDDAEDRFERCLRGEG